MDNYGQHALIVLNALATAVDQLQSFGYKLYLQTKAANWKQPSSVVIGGKGFCWYERRFDRAFLLGFGLQVDSTGDHSIIFSIVFAWDSASWFVQACVEDEDTSRDSITDDLWLSREYFAATVRSRGESV
jgi:hypothetical protein